MHQTELFRNTEWHALKQNDCFLFSFCFSNKWTTFFSLLTFRLMLEEWIPQLFRCTQAISSVCFPRCLEITMWTNRNVYQCRKCPIATITNRRERELSNTHAITAIYFKTSIEHRNAIKQSMRSSLKVLLSVNVLPFCCILSLSNKSEFNCYSFTFYCGAEKAVKLKNTAPEYLYT